jgi:hypothetical protein
MTQTASTPVAALPATTQFKPLRLVIAGALALALNLAALAIGHLAGASLKVSAPEAIDWVSVTATTLGTMLVGGAISWLLIRKWPRARGWAAWGGLIFGLATMPMSFIAAADLATGCTLASMHVITSLAWLFAVKPSATTASA